MTRSGFSPLLATLQLLTIGIGVPLWVISRLSGSLMPMRPMDAVLVMAIVCWALLAKAFVEREDTLDSLVAGPGTPLWFARRLVDESVLGVGIVQSEHEPVLSLASTITMPRELQPGELPEEAAWPGLQVGSMVQVGDRAPATMPTLLTREPNLPLIGESEEYIVGRGDTFWSIAEATLGDGRDWTVLLAMNLGREVAPGTTLTDTDELRIGWSILVPVLEVDTEEER